jgi:Ca2+-binding EF-hand superfamily protein
MQVMTPGIFRECMKRAFGMRLTPGEVAYLVTLFDTTHTNHITCQEFLNRFITMGAQKRYERHTEFLQKERASHKEKKALEEQRLRAQADRSELKIDWHYNQEDLLSAKQKMIDCAAKFDKNHPAAPSLEGFTVGYLTAGQFRELAKQAFKLHLEPKELAAVIRQFPYNDEATTLDPKAFVVAFTKMGTEERDRIKAAKLAQQRETLEREEAEKQRKKKLLDQRQLLAFDDTGFTESDRNSAMQKLREISAKYDKNAPGCPSLEAFEAQYLIPSAFRDVLRRSFGVHFTPKELSAILDTYKDKRGNLICHDFLVAFMKMGADQRAQEKLIELEKQRLDNIHRKTEHARKMREAEEKMVLEINYDFTPEHRATAFKKLAGAAKKYDRSHPGCVALDGFQCLELEPGAFRDIVRRTFRLTFEPAELGAVVQHFDVNGNGKVHCKEFEGHFLKVGIAERAKDHSESIRFQREDTKMREKENADKLAAQWAKHEVVVTDSTLSQMLTDADRNSALEKLTTAAFKYDAASPGPIGLNAFKTSVMSPAVFREMLRRSFDMKLTDGELLALIEMFEYKEGAIRSAAANKHIDCNEFITKFIQLGYQKRTSIRAQQLDKQRTYSVKVKEHGDNKKKELEDKKEVGVSKYFVG